MILKELVIINLIENKIQKKYKFKDVGVNLILGVKREQNEDSNGVGKSDMIDSMRYVLGKSIPSQFNNAILKEKDIFFTLKIQLRSGETIYLGRRVLDSDNGYMLSREDIALDITQWEYLLKDKYKDKVQDLIFEQGIVEEAPPFLSILEYVIRDEKQGFNGITLTSRNVVQNYRILNFLSQLPYNLEKEIKPLKEEQKDCNRQIALIKTMEEEILKLRGKEKRLEDEISRISKIIQDVDLSEKFDIDEVTYRDNKERLNQIQTEIFELQYILKQYKQNIVDLEDKAEKIQRVQGLDVFYNQIVGYFPEQLKKNYAEMEEFYKFMLSNRGTYFKEKIEEVENKLEKLKVTRQELKTVLTQAGKILQNTDLVDDINSLSEELTSRNKELAEVKVRIEMYNNKSQINKQMNKITANILNINQNNERMLEVHEEQKKFLEEMFAELIGVAYSAEEGFLEYIYENKTDLKSTTGRIKIDCKIIDEKSHGRLYMKINLFDLAWFLSRVVNDEDIQVLMHDGSYCKPDPIVKEKTLLYIDKKLKEIGRGQYFVTANVDELTTQLIEKLRAAKSIVAELDRQDDNKNRFLGFKYQNI